MTPASNRQAALAAALRANLKRRKAAGRAKPSSEPEAPVEGAAGEPDDAPAPPRR